MPFYLNNHSIQESIHYTPNPLTKMNNTPNYAPGITADEAKFQKSLVDANHQLNLLEKLMAKQAISNRIADPIDRNEELMLDDTEYRAALAHEFVDAMPWICNKQALHRSAHEFEELRKQLIHREAEHARQ